MERRNTIQRTLVLNAVRTLHRHVTADEVTEYIRGEHPSIGKGTVYRNLKILSDEGEIRHIGIPGGPDRFDFTTQPHYHMQCARCGKVLDVDMAPVPDLESRIRDTHGIRFLGYDILFRGICPDCHD